MPRHDPASVNYPLSTFLADVWEYTFGYRRRLLFWYTVFFLFTLIALIIPILTAQVIDYVTVGNFTIIPYLIVAISILEYGRILARNRIKFIIYKLGESCRLDSRQKWISQILRFDLKWHDTQNSGKKISILSRGSEQLKTLVQFVTRGGGGIDIFISIIGVIIVFSTLNLKYALLSLFNVAFYVITLTFLTKDLNRKRHQVNQISDHVMGKNFDFFANMSLIKSLGIGQSVNRVLFKKESELKDKSVKYTFQEFNKWVYINTISQIYRTLALFLIVTDIVNHRISLGSFFIYTGYIDRLQDGLSSLTDWVNDLIEKYLGLFRVRQLLHSGVTTTEGGSKLFPHNLEKITINNLSFSYSHHSPILDHINLTLSAGQKYGFVGASGSGKTTLGKLLLKLYLPQHGFIAYNNLKLNHINSESLHQHLSVAPQESEIFNLSFKENVTISSTANKFNKELYDLAIKTAECGPILTKIKNNHQAMLGEKGIKLSGGERQRLGIARAIYKNTPVIIFDESTSALDSKTEAKILQNLEKYFESKTIIWIAHRLSTLRFTDQIIVFDQGQVVEQGSFRTLLAHQGTFFDLWQIQKKTNLK